MKDGKTSFSPLLSNNVRQRLVYLAITLMSTSTQDTFDKRWECVLRTRRGVSWLTQGNYTVPTTKRNGCILTQLITLQYLFSWISYTYCNNHRVRLSHIQLVHFLSKLSLRKVLLIHLNLHASKLATTNLV